MKKQRIDRFARLIKFENLQNEYGSDEALWQAEVECWQSQNIVGPDLSRRLASTLPASP